MSRSPSTPTDIRQEEAIQHLLERMPDAVANSFTDTQLTHIKTAIGARSWGKHTIDCRGTLSFPFARWRYYYVFLLGRNRRHLSEREQKISAFMTALVVLIVLSLAASVILLALYLLKSYAGIDIFPGFSFGIWDYFKEHYL